MIRLRAKRDIHRGKAKILEGTMGEILHAYKNGNEWICVFDAGIGAPIHVTSQEAEEYGEPNR